MSDERVDVLHRFAWPLLGLIFVAGCTLRLWSFDAYWINPDEGIYYSMVSWSRWSDFWREYAGNAHPPLFYLALRAVSSFSTEIAPLRFLTLVFGCGCIPASFLLARECVGRGTTTATLTGLLAALLTAISHTAIVMSQVIRPYTLQIFALTLGLFFLVRYVQRGGRRSMPLYAFWMSVSVLTHFSTLVVLAGVAVTFVGLLILRRLNGQQIRTMVVWNLPVLAIIAGLYFLHLRPILENSDLAKESLSTWLRAYLIDNGSEIWPRLLGVLSMTFGRSYEGPAAVALLAGIVLAVYRKKSLITLLTIAVFAMAVIASMAHKYPLGCSRHSLYLIAVLTLPMAFAIAYGLTEGLLPAVVTVVIGTALLYDPGRVSIALESPRREPVAEQLLSREDFERVSPVIDNVQRTAGVLVLPLQSYYFLLPEFARESQGAEWSRDKKLRRFRWGERDVVVLADWGLSLAFEDLGKSKHLYEFSRNVDLMMPDLRVGQRDDVLFFFSGWSGTAETLRAFRVAGDPNRSLVRRITAVPGFTAIEFALGQYRRAIAEALRSLGR